MKRIFSILLLMVSSYFLFAQTNNKVALDSIENISPLGEVNDTVQTEFFFGTDVPLEMILKYDITDFVKNKNKGEYLDAVLQINYKDQTVTKNIRIKARGNFRRGQCAFPPLFLNFKTDKIENTELQGMKKIKIVTHCSSSKNNETYIFKEYLVYKLYNVLTDKSFRVRLLDLSYIDTGKKQKNYRQHGFIIEPIELVAKRANSIEIESEIVKGVNVAEEDADRVALFNYMFGNTDWRFKGGHNMKFIKSMTTVTDKVLAVPYDFDFSGFVDTYYSFPQEWATTCESTTDREYLGYCRNNEDNYLKTIELFKDKKEEILDTINDFQYLSEKEKETLLDFINEFYSEINNTIKESTI